MEPSALDRNVLCANKQQCTVGSDARTRISGGEARRVRAIRGTVVLRATRRTEVAACTQNECAPAAALFCSPRLSEVAA